MPSFLLFLACFDENGHVRNFYRARAQLKLRTRATPTPHVPILKRAKRAILDAFLVFFRKKVNFMVANPPYFEKKWVGFSTPKMEVMNKFCWFICRCWWVCSHYFKDDIWYLLVVLLLPFTIPNLDFLSTTA